MQGQGRGSACEKKGGEKPRGPAGNELGSAEEPSSRLGRPVTRRGRLGETSHPPSQGWRCLPAAQLQRRIWSDSRRGRALRAHPPPLPGAPRRGFNRK